MILAVQFESFIDPFIIMLTVPLAVGGGVFSLWYFNQTQPLQSDRIDHADWFGGKTES